MEVYLHMKKLNTEQCKLVENNIPLIYYIAKRYPSFPIEEEIGRLHIALCKAALSFEAEKKVTFCTYASTVITNEILMYFRYMNKPINRNVTSIYTELNGHEDYDSPTQIIDTLSSGNLEDNVIYLDLKKELTEMEYNACMLASEGYKQKIIGEKLNLSQSYVSRVLKSAEKKLKKAMRGE